MATKGKKHRHHDLNDPANKETRWIEPSKPKTTTTAKTKKTRVRAPQTVPVLDKSGKVKMHREVLDLREREQDTLKEHEHAYEKPPQVANQNLRQTKGEHNLINRKNIHTKKD